MAQAPVISSFSPDTSDSDTTDQDVLSLVGTAPDNSTVDLYSGSTLLGATTANSSGVWSFTTPTLANGAYSFTATDTVSGVTSAASAALDVNVVPATTVTGVKSSASGTEFVGKTITLTIDLSAAVTVTGTPTLTLNDGGTATYAGGSGTDAISFTYTVGSSNLSVASLAITSVNLPTGAMITDGNGDAAVMSGAMTSFSGLGVDTYNDGAANAPAGTPQLPNLLNVNSPSTQTFGETLVTRPPWNVAGVDYAVGVPAGTTLNDPVVGGVLAAALVAQGCSLSGDVINLNGSNQTISGWDFANGGYVLNINGSNDTVENNNFAFSSSADASASGGSLIGTGTSAVNTTIIDNTLQGNGYGTIGIGLIDSDSPGTTTIEYNSIANAYAEDLVIGTPASSGVNIIIQDNLIENAGMGFSAGAHGDWIQLGAYNGDTSYVFDSVNINYNTWVQDVPYTSDPTQGITYAPETEVKTADYSNNTVIVAPGAYMGPAFVGYDLTWQLASTIDNNYAVFHTYPDNEAGITLNWDGGGPYSGTETELGNINLQTGTSDDNAATTVTSVTPSPASGVETPGETMTFTVQLSAAVTVKGTPTLTLNDGGTATYKSGSGTNSLVFAYGVGSSDSTVTALAINSVNLPSGAAITDSNGNAAVMTGAVTSFFGLEVDTANGTVTPPPPDLPAAPVISTGVENSNASVTLTGTAPDGSTVTVSDGGTAALGTATASSTGAWSFTTADLSAGSYAFTATDTTSAGTSTASSPFDVTVTSSSPPPPAAPVISTGVENSNESVTLTGTAPDGSTVTVSDGSTTALGTATASSTGAWSFTTADLSAGSYAFTATDTMSAGTSTASSPFDVTVTSSSPPPSSSNLVANGNFATGNFTDWTLGGNYTSTYFGPEIFIDTDAEGGSTYAAGMGSVGSDGTLSQTIATTAGQTYTLSFWLQNEGSSPNDFSAIWNGQTLLSLSNAAQSGYSEYTYTVTATGSTTTLEFSAANGPSQWDLDNVSLTTNATSTPPPPAAPVISTGVANSNASVTLTGTAPDGSTVTVSDGGTTALGTATASSTGAWSFTTADLSAGSYAFTATDTMSAGTSTASSPFDVTVTSSSPPPSSSNLVANGNFATGNFTDWTLGGNYTSTYFGPEIFIDTDAEGGSTYAAGMGSVGSDGTLSQTIATTAGQTYTLSFWLQNEGSSPNDFSAIWNGQTLLSLSNAAQSGYSEYTYTVTATGSTTTLEFSAANGPSQWDLDNVSLTTNATSTPPPPAAPVISTGVANSNASVTLTGTAPDGSTVTVSDGGTTALGTATASSTGAWSFTTADLSAGSYAFTATDTMSAGTSTASSPFDVTVTSSSPPPSSSNLVANGNFATGNFTDWTLGGNYTSTYFGPEIFIDTDAEGGSTYAAGMGSVGSDGTLSQTIATTAGQTYTLSFWLQNEGSSPNDFSAIWNGQTLLSLSNAAQSGYSEYTYTVTATGSTTTLEFSAANGPSQWDLDNISLTANSTPPPAVTIGTGATLELSAADSASVTFNGSTGTLILESPSTFSGEIFNFTGNGSLSGSDQIDLTNINFNSVKASYANGVLTVKDGTNTDKLDFNGSYKLANFDFASDGSGGTIVYDPPAPTSKALAPTSSGQTSGGQGRNFTGTVSGFGAQDVMDLPGIAFDAQTTLGYLPGSNQTGGALSLAGGIQSAKIALLGNYMASSFAVASDHHSDSMVTEAWQASNQSLLTHPQHT